jgi:exopolysaccharide biosynthesis protein
MLPVWVMLAWLAPLAAPGESSPIEIRHLVRQQPNFSIFEVWINLADARVQGRVVRGGPAPEQQTNWVTTLLPVGEVAEREGFDLAINGDFFEAEQTRDIEGKNTGYVRGKAAAPVGFAMTDGRLWHRYNHVVPCLAITTNGQPLIVSSTEALSNPAVNELVSGGQIIVSNGLPVHYPTPFAVHRHPRTAVGLDRAGNRLLLLVVDGRQPQLSVGMSLDELAGEMIRAGCDRALNLDGGGSSTLVYRDPADQRLKVVNSPSDGHPRSVADVLGFVVRAPRPAWPTAEQSAKN